MAEVIYKVKKIDIKIKKKSQELKKKLVEKSKNETNCYHDLVILEI